MGFHASFQGATAEFAKLLAAAAAERKHWNGGIV